MATTESMSDERGAFRQAWDRLTAGNIDERGSEAFNRWGAGRDESIATSDAVQEKRFKELPPPVEATEVAEPDDAQQFSEAFNAKQEGEKTDDDARMQPGVRKFPAPNEVAPSQPKAPVKAAPAKPTVKQAATEPSVEPAVTKAVDLPAPAKKPLRQVTLQEQGENFTYGTQNPPEPEEIQLLDKPNAFGSKYMPKSVLEQIRMIWGGKDYAPRAGAKVLPVPPAK